jgi:hypothetical protein
MDIIVGGPASVAQGSMKLACEDCKADVWLAKSGQKFMRENAAVVVCMQCAAVRLSAYDGEVEVAAPSKDAFLEDLGITSRN